MAFQDPPPFAMQVSRPVIPGQSYAPAPAELLSRIDTLEAEIRRLSMRQEEDSQMTRRELGELRAGPLGDITRRTSAVSQKVWHHQDQIMEIMTRLRTVERYQ